MKKKVFAFLIATIVLCNTFSSDFVSLAEGTEEETYIQEDSNSDVVEPQESSDESEEAIDESDKDEILQDEPTEITDVVSEDESVGSDEDVQTDETVTFSLDDMEIMGLDEDLIETSFAEVASVDDEYALVDSVKVKNGDTELKSGDAISFNDGLSVEYSFKKNIVLAASEDDANSLEDNDIVIFPGKTYKLPSLDVSKLDLTGDLSSTVTDKDSGTKVGTIQIDTSGNVTLAIESVDADKIGDGIGLEIGNFVINFSLNKQEIGQATEYSLEIGSNKYDLSISDNKAEAPTISTTAAVDGEKVTWTNTITNAAVPKDYSDTGYVFKAVLDSNQTFDKGSFKVGDNTVDSSRISETKNTDGTTTITYTIPGSEVNKASGGQTTITYSCDVDFLGNGGAAAKETSSRTVTNKVSIVESADLTDTISSANGSATVNASKKIPSLEKAINNTGGKLVKSDDGKDNGVGQWTITVNSGGYTLKNLRIYDYMILGENSSDYTFTLDEKSLEVKKGDTQLSSGTDYKFYNTSGNVGNKSYSWYVEFTDVPVNTVYTINYNTLLSNYTHYLRTNHTAAPNNTAFMTYEYEKGTDNWVSVEGPSMNVASKITTNAGISASTGTSSVYNPATHEITWTVTVNQENEELTNVVVIDEIPTNQTFVSTTVESDVSNATHTENGNTITFNLGDAAKNNKVTFKVVTKLTDNEVGFWSKNVPSKTYSNRFSLKATELGDKKLEVTATCTCKSQVITLKADPYNYATHEIPYTIEVNDNKMLMTGVSVADDLGALGLELVEDTVKLDGNTLGTTGSGAHYTYSNGKLVVYGDDIKNDEVGQESAKSKITFTARVTDAKLLDASKNTQSVTINNKAELTTDAYKDAVTETASASTQFTNNIIIKEASVDKTNLSADYVVTFNANQIELPSNIMITDTLGASMDLDISSVKLFVGSVNPTTGAVTNSGTEETGYTVKTSINSAGQTVLSVVLEPRTGNKNAYYLTYSATATDFSKNDYSNSVALSGYTNSVISTVNVEAKVLATVSASATKLAKIEITNVDAEDNGIKLSNSTFEIQDNDGKVVRTLVTKANGTAKAIGGKITNGEYTLVQKTVQDGYVIESEPIKVTVSNNKATVTVENKKQTKDVQIYKEDGMNKFVAGAALEITWKNSANQAVKADSWTTEESAHKFTASYDTVYTLTEKTTPFGYESADAISFKVDKEHLYQYVGGKWTEVESIQMIDKPLDTCEFSVSKVSAGQGNELVGAELIISKKNSLEAAKKDYIEKWISDGSAKEFAFPKGTYYLYELSAPTGYTVAESISFKVTEEYKLQVADKDGNYVDSDDSKIVMTDDYNASKTYKITLSPETLGMNPEIFKAMKFQLFTIDPTDGEKLVLVEPVTAENTGENAEDNEIVYNINYQDEYILIPSETVEGYDPVDPITIKVIDDNKIVAKTLDDDNFKELTSFEELGEKVTPEPTPIVIPEETPENVNTQPTDSPEAVTENEAVTTPESSNNGTVNTPSYAAESTGTATTPATLDTNLEMKENTIEAGAQLQPEAAETTGAAGHTLAKTGGFIGTLMAYAFALFAIVFGLFLVFGKEKRAK